MIEDYKMIAKYKGRMWFELTCLEQLDLLGNSYSDELEGECTIYLNYGLKVPGYAIEVNGENLFNVEREAIIFY